jgi:glycosyltransferase involved in cell wall biosynthesis
MTLSTMSTSWRGWPPKLMRQGLVFVASGAHPVLPNLLVVSRFPDPDFLNCDYTFVHHQLAHLRQHFEEVYVLAPAPRIPPVLRPLRGVNQKLRLRLAKVDYAYDNVRVYFARYGLLESRPASGAPLPSVLAEMDRIIAEHELEFDLIHAHMATLTWYATELGKKHGVPVVSTIHDDDEGLARLLAGSDPRPLQALRACDALIRVTPSDVEDVERTIGREGELVYLPNGFDAARVPQASASALRESLELPRDRPLFVAVARWTERKDPLILLEALARLRDDPDPLPALCMVGEDLMGGRLERCRSRLGLEDDVLLVGQRHPDEVLRYMRAATAVLLYSQSEGNPTVMFEALGCGRPFIGSSVGGVPAVLADAALGGFGPPGDVSRLADLMRRASRTDWDEDYIQAHAGRYTWESVAHRTHDEVLAPALERGRSGGAR